MDANHPKRRKDKLNPYTIYQSKDGEYFISFVDGTGVHQHLNVSQELYDLFDTFELEDVSYMNVVDRHIEHSEQTDESLNARAAVKPAMLEDEVILDMRNKELHKAIMSLPEVQRRRILLYYFSELTFEQIAEMEGCKHPAIIKSVKLAIQNLKKYFQK